MNADNIKGHDWQSNAILPKCSDFRRGTILLSMVSWQAEEQNKEKDQKKQGGYGSLHDITNGEGIFSRD